MTNSGQKYGPPSLKRWQKRQPDGYIITLCDYLSQWTPIAHETQVLWILYVLPPYRGTYK